MKHVIVGTAGHVDHGKTTLIRALTGINTDRLAEEQARGMTIDLGFAFLSLGDAIEPGDAIEVGIVDVPGHEKFIKNMLAGAGGIDVALVVVAADEGPMQQTREHLDILTVLGVTHGVVALTKIDRADADLQEIARLETVEALAKTSLAGIAIVPVSAETNEGLSELRAALKAVCEECPVREANAPVRLPVDRVFSLPGVGTVVTGTLISGTLHTGDALAVEPQNLATKARTLQTHGSKLEAATPGMRIAVNIPGIDVATIERGAVLCTPQTLKATTLFDAHLTLLPDAPRPLTHRERVRLHLGTGETLARVLLLDTAQLEPGQTGVAQLLCETPVAPTRQERFVLRTYSPQRAIGGGIVADPNPVRLYRRGDEAALARFQAKDNDATGSVYAALSDEPREKTLAELAKATGESEASLSLLLEELADEGKAFTLDGGERWLSDRAVIRLRDTLQKTLATYHRQNPYRIALPRESLRIPLGKAAVVKDFNALLRFLIQEGLCVEENIGLWENPGMRLTDHVINLSPRWEEARDNIEKTYQAAGFSPPAADDFQRSLPRDVVVPAILTILTDAGKLVPLEGNLYLHADTYNSAKAAIRTLAESPEGITVGSVRDATNSSRKIILPLLEHFDAVKFTRRIGDTRVLV